MITMELSKPNTLLLFTLLITLSTLLLHTHCTPIPADDDQQASQPSDDALTTTSLTNRPPSFELQVLKARQISHLNNPTGRNVWVRALFSKGRIFADYAFKAVGHPWYVTGDTDPNWNPDDPDYPMVLHKKIPASWPDLNSIPTLDWPNVRLKYDEAVDILLSSGATKEWAGYTALKVLWGDRPRQPYFMWMSGSDESRWVRVGMVTRDVSFEQAGVGEVQELMGLEGLAMAKEEEEGGGSDDVVVGSPAVASM